jgi:hypothetical protein
MLSQNTASLPAIAPTEFLLNIEQHQAITALRQKIAQPYIIYFAHYFVTVGQTRLTTPPPIEFIENIIRIA